MNIFKQFLRSLYSPKDIAGFRFQGMGKTVLYIFFLTLIAILPSAYHFTTALTEGAETIREKVTTEMPAFEIKEGILDSQSEEPAIITKDGLTIFVDDTGKVSKEDIQAKSTSGIGLLRTEFVFYGPGGLQSYPYSMLNGMEITNKTLAEMLDSFNSMLVIIVPIFLLVLFGISAAVQFIEVTLLAFFGMLVKTLLGRNLPYGMIWKMTAYSITLPTVFFTIMGSLNTPVRGGHLVDWFAALLVLFLAIKETPQQRND
ncbi:DUF1189 domain-containing protein [Bacillus sp. M6-12]|uniref:DUF1189 domain-containing protein n=1 Tax=Bacillus sp. M6-12 TaxID=2054166 RepID=UPI000C77C853|nr:DUF1189 domain-containing protein [Bacillus sp. M6-12]PLS15219.1 DUF1189 domain-containing protein [Bacillus sp. M6-12]